MKTLIVEYRSEAYWKLDRNWITWEIFEYNGIKLAKMIQVSKY
jgi:hypothetical protein